MKTVEEAKQDASYKSALTELLYQLADDDFIVAYRGSEWLGLAPHIEEDVAFSSISQDTMGHATMFYQLLEELGEGDADHLAHGRTPAERKNAIILEEVNGPGHYLKEPRYDWAFAVVRHYFYTLAKKIKMESVKQSSYEPLQHVAVKVNMELYYHHMHWKTWFMQLTGTQGEARERMLTAVETVLEDFGGVLTLGPKEDEITKHGLIEGEEFQRKRWLQEIKPIFESLNIEMPKALGMKRGDGRAGEHTEDLDSAIDTLTEVYRQDPAATW
ncbi:1,2-phenylacetyl-CoA epoxidase subunit PaaC [Pontibacillus sp. HMF3514]|uniref:1,2-phenylacetyl-CoA epoxidase subunit PaaC n=1 Tax=Pontibacillus sp. HMF3514 TaxID=2692425 RepID=UPI00132019B9|nr:1,2-phenylacetyl-CoA epoxidase subunit PaaC [Pontibacillus sp. HMF3514]QHE52742.1 phenylacetate-CoA oxygenase subunit PaaC [Pontibacillus sp. HMF3514]